MASNLQNLQRIHFCFAEGLMENGLRGASDGELTKTFDLNFPPTNRHTIRRHTANMVNVFNNEIKPIWFVSDTRKRYLFGYKLSAAREGPTGGSMLKLLTNPRDAYFNVPIFASSSAWVPYLIMKPNGGLWGFGNMGKPILVCMGCKNCHMYIMVSDAAPKCPKCKSVDLLDVPSLINNYPMKKARKN